MSNSESSKKLSCEDEWAFVDIEGSIVPKKELSSVKGNVKRKRSKVRARKDEYGQEPGFEILQKELTTSTIIETTKIPPLEKNYHHDDDDHAEDWGIVYNPNDNFKIIDDSSVTLQQQKLDGPSLEFSQIPDKQHGNCLESFSDSSSSTCSFDIIDENKTTSHVSEVNAEENMDITEIMFHLDFPTLVALFCLTTALGFVIGHGVGIATRFLVVETPNLKIPTYITGQKTPKGSPEEELKKNQDSQLEGKIKKWKHMYRNVEKTQEQGNASERGLPGVASGLKEAHKQLSLENFKLKKARDDIQKEFEMMKVMSRHWRSQLDNLKTEAKQNKSYVVEVLKNELEYLEGVYIREKRLADMWRDEQGQRDEQKMKSKVNSWKEFKEQWNKESKEDYSESTPTSPDEDTCTERGDCIGTSQDTSGYNTHDMDEDSRTMDSGMSLFWQHLKETSKSQTNNENENKNTAGEVDEGLTQGTSSIDRIAMAVNSLAGTTKDDNDLHKMNKETDYEKMEDISIKADNKNNEENQESKNLDDQSSGWFHRDVMEIDDDIVVAYENKDIKDHKLYGFWDGNFREICSSPGDVFVMSMKKNCLDATLGFVISAQNDSPQPIEFFAVLPNGKVKHQQIAEEVKITMVHLGKQQGLLELESEVKPIVYEAIIGADGKLLVTPQKDGQRVNDKPMNEEDIVMTDREKLDVISSESSTKTSEPTKTEENSINQEKPNPYLTVPKSFLQPGESYVLDECSRTLYRRIVSVHQYPINEYQGALSQNHGAQERVFYRFPEKFLFEKFVVRDEVMSKDGEEQGSTKEDQEELLVESITDAKPRQYEVDVKNTVEQLLESHSWEDGNKVSVLMTYDTVQRILTSIYVTLCSVKHNEVISHKELRNGKMEKNGSITKMTSYRMTGNDLVRIIQTDEVYDSHTEESIGKDADGQDADGLKYGKSISEDGGDSRKLSSPENEGGSHNKGGFGNNGSSESKNNSKNEHNPGMATVEKHHVKDASESLKPEEESPSLKKSEELCNLKLGENNTNEYWTIYDQGILATKERVERVEVSLMHRVEDAEKLNVISEKVEETVSYVYCGDGSVVKTWRQTEKITKEEIKNVGSHAKTKYHSFASNENDGFCLDDKDCKRSSKDGGDDDKVGNDDDYDHEDGDDNDEDNNDVDDEDDNDVDDEDDNNDDDNNNDDNNNDDNDDDDNGEINEIDDAHPSKSNTPGEEDNNKQIIHEIGKGYRKYSQNEWLNLKMQQRQFKISKKQNLRLQERMIEEWKRTREEYRRLQKRLKNRESEEFLENTRMTWKNMKYQQQQFDDWKTRIMEELKDNLNEEWGKLKKKREEIELKEKQLNFEREALVPNNNMLPAQNQGGNMEITDVEVMEEGTVNVDERASMAWEMAYGEDKEMQGAEDVLTRYHEGKKNNLRKLGKITEKNIESNDFHQDLSPIAQIGIGDPNKEAPDSFHKTRPHAETQWEIELKKLRKELDRLYEMKLSADGHKRTRHELQLTNEQTTLPDRSKEQTKQKDSQSETEDLIQPKCPVKCPKESGESESKEKVFTKAPEGPSVQEYPKMKFTKKTKKNGNTLYDFIHGGEYINKLKVNGESDDASQLKITGPLASNEKKRKWRKKHSAKHGDNDGNLFKKEKNKRQRKKQEKRGFHSYKKDHETNNEKQRKAYKQNNRSFDNQKA